MALAVAVAVVLAVLVGVHVAVNARLLRRPPSGRSTVDMRVAVLLPVRDEEHRLEPCLRSLLGQDAEVVVLDDGSTDGTARLVRRVGGDRVRLVTGAPLPPGWLGKPHACHQLAATGPAADADVLVFVDADVVLAPGAVTAAVATLDGFDLLTPYPRIVATGLGQRLVQPLLQWSWLAFLPLRAMERSPRPALVAAGGQFLVVRRAAYEAAGGHAAVRDRVLEDIELARAVKRAGGRIALADGSALATCRMYGSWPELVEGYTKSLWASFGSPAGAAAVVLVLGAVFVLPALAALAGWLLSPLVGLLGLLGYTAGVAGRMVAARVTGGRAVPDALGHPASVLLFGWLVARSYRRRRQVRWKGRPVA
jgi:cellulose synthase/poly-beta-1,6-N-acetylglucosamine synthase-like glycosyltransferase